MEITFTVLAWVAMAPVCVWGAMMAFILANELFGGAFEAIRDRIDPGWR